MSTEFFHRCDLLCVSNTLMDSPHALGELRGISHTSRSKCSGTTTHAETFTPQELRLFLAFKRFWSPRVFRICQITTLQGNPCHCFSLPWTSLICVSSPKCVYMCVRRCPSQTPNAFICVSPNAFICVSPNAFICVSPNAFICVSPNVSAESTTELASLAYLCSLRSHVFLTV